MKTSTEKLEQWTTTLNNWRDSGLSQAAYCRRENIKPHLFTYYKYKLEGGGAKTPDTLLSSGFTQVAVNARPADSAPGLKLVLTNGMIVSGIQSDNLPVVRELMEMVK